MTFSRQKPRRRRKLSRASTFFLKNLESVIAVCARSRSTLARGSIGAGGRGDPEEVLGAG